MHCCGLCAGCYHDLCAKINPFCIVRENMNIKKVINMAGVSIVILIMFLTYKNYAAPAEAITGDYVQQAGGVQNARLRIEGGTYIMEPSTLELGKTVRMEVDMNTVRGCARSVNI